MPYKIVNVSLAHEHAMKRRSAAKMHMEPVIAGQRLLLRSSRVLTDEQYNANEARLKEFEAHGVITIHPMTVEKPIEKKVEKKAEPPVMKEKLPPAPPAPPAPEPAKSESTPPPASAEVPPPPPPAPEQPRKDGKKQGK